MQSEDAEGLKSIEQIQKCEHLAFSLRGQRIRGIHCEVDNGECKAQEVEPVPEIQEVSAPFVPYFNDFNSESPKLERHER